MDKYLYTNFHEGKDIEPLEVSQWHLEALDKLKKDKNLNNYSHASGNALVLASRDTDSGEIQIIEVRGYHSYTYYVLDNMKVENIYKNK